jgi:hypothetical protein
MFRYEKDMVELVEKKFISDDKTVILEVKHLFGIPDMVVYDNIDIVAIEFKLRYWQKALKQAFRYKNFSNKVYVYLDNDYIEPAKRNLDTFIQFEIGLCGVDNDNNIITYYEPKRNEPFCKHSTNTLLGRINSINQHC